MSYLHVLSHRSCCMHFRVFCLHIRIRWASVFWRLERFRYLWVGFVFKWVMNYHSKVHHFDLVRKRAESGCYKWVTNLKVLMIILWSYLDAILVNLWKFGPFARGFLSQFCHYPNRVSGVHLFCRDSCMAWYVVAQP